MPTEVHTPTYGDDGRVAQIDVERESPWNDEQRNLMAALADYEATINEYGVPVVDATSPAADPDNRDGTHYYRAESIIDWSVAAVEAATKAKRAEYAGDDPYAGSRRWRVSRIDR
jgi:hypothetical protein